jgi:microcystin degradation protein MlrC
MKIAIAGISVECDAFSPIYTEYEDISVYRGRKLLQNELWLIRGMVGRLRESLKVEICPIIWATALPGGPLRNRVYQDIKIETVRLLKDTGPFDGVLLAMHGSLAVENLYINGDTDYVFAVRQAVGPDVRIGIAFDLHGNITPEIIRAGDVFSALRTAPHKDDPETGYRVADQLLQVVGSGAVPTKAFIKIPILVHGEQAVTHYDPAKRLFENLFSYDERSGVLQSILMAGYVWHDMPWIGMAALVTTKNNPKIAKVISEEIAQYVWDSRFDFKFSMETANIEDGIQHALLSDVYPVFLTDSGDNVTSGSPGDLTIVLQHLIKAQVTDAVVPGIAAPHIVYTCRKAGKGANVTLHLGCEHTLFKNQIMDVEARVEETGESFIQFGPYPVNEGPWVRVEINGILVTFHERRIGIVAKSHFQALGINPERHRIYVVKQGYLFPELENAAKRYILLLSPGATEYDFSKLIYKRVQRPVFPLDTEMIWEASGNSILI